MDLHGQNQQQQPQFQDARPNFEDLPLPIRHGYRHTLSPFQRCLVNNLNNIFFVLSIVFYITAVVILSIKKQDFKIKWFKSHKVAGDIVFCGLSLLLYTTSMLLVLIWAEEETYRETRVVSVRTRNLRWILSRAITTVVPLVTVFIGLYLEFFEPWDSLIISVLLLLSFTMVMLIIKRPEDGGLCDIYISCVFTIMVAVIHRTIWVVFLVCVAIRLALVLSYLCLLDRLQSDCGPDAAPPPFWLGKCIRSFFKDRFSWCYPLDMDFHGYNTRLQSPAYAPAVGDYVIGKIIGNNDSTIIVDIGNPMSILANEASMASRRLADLPKNTLRRRGGIALDDDDDIGIINNDTDIVNRVGSIIFLRVANIYPQDPQNPARNPELYYDKAFDPAAVAHARATAVIADAANHTSAIATDAATAAADVAADPATAGVDPAIAADAAATTATAANDAADAAAAAGIRADNAATAAAATALRVNHGLETDGYIFHSPIGFRDTGLAMRILERELQCQIKVGRNGYTWVQAHSRDTEVFIANTIWQIQSLRIDQQRIEVNNLLQRLR